MNKSMDKIQIVLASPSDLTEERAMIKELVEKTNSIYESRDLHFDLRMWENTSPGISMSGPQGVIDVDLCIESADIFICLYWKRVGTILPLEGVAGTEHELNTAIKSFQQHQFPDIKVFFKDTSDCEETADIKHIKEIAERLKHLSLYATFKTIDDLKDAVSKILQEIAADRFTRKVSVDPKTEHVIRAGTARDLLTSIHSGNTVLLARGFYDVLEETNNDTIHHAEVYDGEEIIISGVENLVIIGNESGLLVKPRYATVLTLKDCKNIKLSGLIIGHVPEKGRCTGAVVELINCKNIQIDSTSLFGCGTYGMVLSNCENVIVNGSQIFECTYGGIIVGNSTLTLKNSTIYDCRDLISSLIEVTDGRLRMENVSIYNCSSNGYAVSVRSTKSNHSWVDCYGVSFFHNTFQDYSNVPNLGRNVFYKDNILTKEQRNN